jgi:hypothetical protein
MRKSHNNQNELISFVNDDIIHHHAAIHNHKKAQGGSYSYDQLHLHEDFSNEIEIDIIHRKEKKINDFNKSENDVL